MSIQGAIFDFDGTLFESMSIWQTAGENFLRSVGCEAEKDLNKKLATMSLLQSAEYFQKQYALPMTIPEIIDQIDKVIEDFYYLHAVPKKEVIPTLTALQDKGVKMCISTATNRHLVLAALKRWDMLRFFDAIFTCTEVGYGKDRPEIFEAARSYLKTPKRETAVFEDAYYAAKTAKDAGFFVVGIADEYNKHPQELKAIADVYVENFSDLEQLLNL